MSESQYIPDPDELEDDAAGEQDELYEHYSITADRGQSPLRLDKFLTIHMERCSRNRIQTAADAGNIPVSYTHLERNACQVGDRTVRTVARAQQQQQVSCDAQHEQHADDDEKVFQERMLTDFRPIFFQLFQHGIVLSFMFGDRPCLAGTDRSVSSVSGSLVIRFRGKRCRVRRPGSRLPRRCGASPP